ncbi:hypothetical protein NL676_001931 [Syzygium grande]|nr:hypothetical protein NL676_001931 [Syzygium grande]
MRKCLNHVILQQTCLVLSDFCTSLAIESSLFSRPKTGHTRDRIPTWFGSSVKSSRPSSNRNATGLGVLWCSETVTSNTDSHFRSNEPRLYSSASFWMISRVDLLRSHARESHGHSPFVTVRDCFAH